MSLTHANRNTQLCQNLLDEGVYYDWVITTAFYSSIHFIDHKIFPCPYDGKVLHDIIHAHRHFNGMKSKHQVREHLVAIVIPAQVGNYKFLDTQCRNARYLNYNVNEQKARIARQKLDEIITECVPTVAAK